MDRHNDQFAVIFNATQKGKIRDKHNTCSNIWFRIKNFYWRLSASTSLADTTKNSYPNTMIT